MDQDQFNNGEVVFNWISYDDIFLTDEIFI